MTLPGPRRQTPDAARPRRRIRAVLVALLATAGLLSPPLGGTTAEAVFPGANGLIAFSMESPQGGDVWTVRPDGTGLRQVTTYGRSGAPRWAPSGRLIAFLRDQASSASSDVWVVRPDGTRARRVTTGVVFRQPPAWSPYGDELIVVRPVSGGSDLFRVPLAGGIGRRITFAARQGCTVDHPSWRGDLVVYARHCPMTYQLRLLDISTGRSQLVVGTSVGMIFWPDFTSNMQIMFMSCGLTDRDPCIGSENVTTIRRDGTGILVHTAACGCESEPSLRQSAPSPDGSRFAVIVTDPGTDGDPMTGGDFLNVSDARTGADLWGCCFPTGRFASAPDWQPLPG